MQCFSLRKRYKDFLSTNPKILSNFCYWVESILKLTKKCMCFCNTQHQMEEITQIPAQIKTNVPVVSINDQNKATTTTAEVEDQPLSWQQLLKMWSSSKLQLTRDHLVNLCSLYTEATLAYVHGKFKQLTAAERSRKAYQLVFNMLRIFDVREVF